jgi:hypothetical protein
MDLASIIKAIESGGNAHAIRFEPHAYAGWAWTPTFDRIVAKHHCSLGTGRMIACTSWGVYQFMGVNVFDPAYAGQVDPINVFAFVADADMQDKLFGVFLKHKGIDFTPAELLADAGKMTKFVTEWNGPANVDGYAALIRSRAAG